MNMDEICFARNEPMVEQHLGIFRRNDQRRVSEQDFVHPQLKPFGVILKY